MGARAVVLLTDFGLSERFVASMKGVIYSVDRSLDIFDLTHDIKPYKIWEASEILAGAIRYWPEETVFVAVVDPGVGSERRSLVAITRTNHIIVAPDNGLITLTDDRIGVKTVREIDEKTNRLPGSENSHTFHGRDIYAYTGARLAAGAVEFHKTGKALPDYIRISFPQPGIDKNTLYGFISKTEEPFGNLATNIPGSLFEKLFTTDETPIIFMEIRKKERSIFKGGIKYVKSFGFVEVGEPLVYIDSSGFAGVALNQKDFAETYKTGSGPDWIVTFKRPE